MGKHALAHFTQDPDKAFLIGEFTHTPLGWFSCQLWMDDMLHHFETMGNHGFLAFTGEASFRVVS